MVITRSGNEEMARQSPDPDGMDEYLGSTNMCDCDKGQVQDKAKEIVQGAETAKEKALRIFYFVRDEIPYGMDYPNAKASRTLRKGIGCCYNKTNLQIALLRALGIPARCHYVHQFIDLLEPVIPRFVYERMPAVAGHPWCECCISGEWIACETVMDEALYKATLSKGMFRKDQIPTIDWDGQSHLIMVQSWIAEDVRIFPSLDDTLREVGKRGEATPPSNRLYGWLAFSLTNLRINKIRLG
jgi:hypothetical protein